MGTGNSDGAAPVLVVPELGTNVVLGRFELVGSLGRGSFGEVYAGVDRTSGAPVAIKLEWRDQSSAHLQLLRSEFAVYRSVGAARGVPRMIQLGATPGATVMVCERLGDDLDTLFARCQRRFSLRTVCLLAVQAIDRIQHHHAGGYVHRDIKPQNLLMGLAGTTSAGTLHLIDYGLCLQFRSSRGVHQPYSDAHKLVGTPRFVSVNTHRGIQQSRRDDMESIAYLLVYFLQGRLPWQGVRADTKAERYARIYAVKCATSAEQLCQGLPVEFLHYLEYCRSLEFDQEPDYRRCRAGFLRLLSSLAGEHEETRFDWNCTLSSGATKRKHAPDQALHNNNKAARVGD